eukprot:TRINITY_DN34851_c0_g1_i1.p2 TRINITY_DN34851_c0_g1~~TRINITY_DN34851_c0_g1_i1.p2  ORF type:complete len:197 (+),score=46.16 TRINITY_DN34851_c0_g1_i1:125-715(+)
MSFRFSNSLVKTFRETLKGEAVKQRLAETVVRGRARGCTVRYTGCGRVEGIEFDNSNTAFLRDPESGRFAPERVSQAVAEAVLDAQQQMASVKQGQWDGVNPRLLTEYATCPELLEPLPHQHFRYTPSSEVLRSFPQVLSSAEVEFGVSAEEASRNRAPLQLADEQAFWTTGRVADTRIDAEARRTGASRQQSTAK